MKGFKCQPSVWLLRYIYEVNPQQCLDIEQSTHFHCHLVLVHLPLLHMSWFQSQHEISIEDTEWPIEATRKLVEAYICLCVPDSSGESSQQRCADPIEYVEKLTDRMTCGTGLSTLNTGFLASLQEEVSQKRLAASSQDVPEDEANTRSLRFTSDRKRMYTTYARIFAAIDEALITRHERQLTQALTEVEEELGLTGIKNSNLIERCRESLNMVQRCGPLWWRSVNPCAACMSPRLLPKKASCSTRRTQSHSECSSMVVIVSAVEEAFVTWFDPQPLGQTVPYI